MKIKGIADLFTKPVERLQNANPETVESKPVGAPSPEAVKLATDFGRKADNLDDSDRRKRVEELKAQVNNGEYKPDRIAVATAVAKELFL